MQRNAEFVKFSDLDVNALAELGQEELTAAQDELIAWVTTYADVRAVRVLIGFATTEAGDALREVVDQHAASPHDDGLSAAAALRGLIRRGEVTNPHSALNALYTKAGKKGRRLVLRSLAELDSDDSAARVQRLVIGLEDSDADNRIAAAKQILESLGLGAHMKVENTSFWLLPFEFGSKDRRAREAARERLDEITLQVAASGPPAVPSAPVHSVGLTAFLTSMADDRQPDFDLTALRTLSGFERDWMRFVLAEQEPLGDDRVARALAALGTD